VPSKHLAAGSSPAGRTPRGRSGFYASARWRGRPAAIESVVPTLVVEAGRATSSVPAAVRAPVEPSVADLEYWTGAAAAQYSFVYDPAEQLAV
jgi:hypothetical protein